MKRVLVSVMLASTGVLVAAGCASNQTDRVSSADCCKACVVPSGAATAVNAKTADALRETLLDERRAQAFYNSVMAKHGQVRPFSNIVHAEERHEAMVESLMIRHGVAIPSDTPANLPAVPDTLAECSRLSVQLERENIAMYDRLLIDVMEPDIRAAFENLRTASKNNHLPAFERWSANTGAASNGPAMAYGGGRRGGNAGYGRQARNGGCGGACALVR